MIQQKLFVSGKRVLSGFGSVMALLLAVAAATVSAKDLSDRVNYGRFEVSAETLNFGLVEVGDRASRLLTVKNAGDPNSGTLLVNTLYLDERDAANYATDIKGGIALQPGESRDLNVYFDPGSVGVTPGMLFITHTGTESVSIIQLQGVGVDSYAGSGLAPPLLGRAEGEGSVSFLKTLLNGVDAINPTSIQFGPDNRLYVAALNGEIFIYDIERAGKNQYQITDAVQIDLIKNILNHDDDGQPNLSVNTRLVTGIAVTGTADSPVIYVTSSDPRIGGGGSGLSTSLDTNSSILSKLTRSNNGWQKLDLVRGLPRSEENHTANGIALNKNTGKLYIAIGGNTNQGSPSNNFATLPEYALSAAIVEIDLLAIGDSTYDLPTLDDEDRPGINDFNDPFGGNRGKNQAILTVSGPVQIHAPGFRNAYDVIISSSGQMYSWDNGPNGGWGGNPGNVCGNDIVEPGDTRFDALHLITGSGYYGGHSNPTRANTGVTFNNSNPQSPVPFGNSVECEYFGAPGSGLEQHPENLSLVSIPASTNGLAEYTATNFNGAMQGDLLAAAFNNKLYRVKLNDAGTSVEFSEALFSNVGGTPLDVIAQGDNDIFPGTIWVTDFSSKSIVVFEPQDFDQQPGDSTAAACSVNDPLADPDNDGFTTQDEIANATNPCSPADFPKDSDADGLSDLLDQDDDNDGLPDTSDAFALDASNGSNTFVPVSFQWENNSTPSGFIADLGFSGLMTDQTTDYSTLFDLDLMTVRGAAGVVTIDSVPDGDAISADNSQQYGFQFGVNVKEGDPQLAAHTRVVAPFAGIQATGFQSMGLFIGNGDQDNYIKLVVSPAGHEGTVELLKELNGEVESSNNVASNIVGSDYVDLYLKLDPSSLIVTAFYQITNGGVTGVVQSIGDALPMPSAWLNEPDELAVGIISTSNSGSPFPATWDFIEVTNNTNILNAASIDSVDTPVNDESRVSVSDAGPVILSGGGGPFDPLILMILLVAFRVLRTPPAIHG